MGIIACRERQNDKGIRIKGTTISKDIYKIPIDVEHPENITKLSELIDSSSISLIPLETTAESVVEIVQQFKVCKGCIYIKSDRQKVIKIFSLDGKYLGEVNAKGRGPEEYQYLNDFEINNDTIVVLDFNRLLMYDRHNFQFIRSVNLKEKGIGALYFKYDHPYYYFKCSNLEVIKASTVVCDDNLNLVSVFCEPSYYTKLNYSSSPYFIPMEREMYYYQVMNDTIYKISEDALEASFILDAGKHSLGYERYNRLPIYNKQFPMPVIPAGYIEGINGFFYADSTLLFTVDYNECQYSGSYSMRTKRTRLWDISSVEDDFMNSQTFWVTDASDGEYFYRMIYPSVFLQDGNIPFKKILRQMNEEDNPVLVKYKFRKF